MSRWLVVAAVLAFILISPRSGRAAPDCPRPSTPCPAALYVSPDGDDARAGTSPETAWRTLARVNDEALQPGDHVFLAGGQTFEAPLRIDGQDLGVADRPVVIGSYGDGRATIVASKGNGIVLENTQGVTIQNVDVRTADQYAGPGSGIVIVTDLPGNVKLDGITVQDVHVSGFDEYGIHVDGNNNKSGFKHLIIERVTAENNALGGIIVDGDYSQDSQSYAHAGVIVRDARVAYSLGVPGTDRPHSGSGIILSDVDGGLIERCIVHDNGERSESRWGGPVGIWAWDVNDIVIQFNESYNNHSRTRDGGGFDLDGGATHSVMQYNYSHDNTGSGFSIISFPYARRTAGNVIRYNISANDSRSAIEHGSILIHGQVYDTLIHNNTVTVDAAGLSGARQAAIQIEPLSRWAPGEPDPDGVLVLNNLFVAADDLPALRMKIDPRRVSLLGNAYFSPGREPIFSWGGAELTGLEAFRAASGQEILNGRDLGISTDPGLALPDRPPTVNDPDQLAQLASYRIRRTSPLVDAGISPDTLTGADPAITRDFFGLPAPRGPHLDIGANEAGDTP